MPGPIPHLPQNGTLLVLRGNSGSGKSTIARALHQHFDHGRSTLIAQDTIRCTILREPDTPDALNIELIELIATTCLPRRQLVIVEGILDADRYGPMLGTLATRARRARTDPHPACPAAASHRVRRDGNAVLVSRLATTTLRHRNPHRPHLDPERHHRPNPSRPTRTRTPGPASVELSSDRDIGSLQ
ncbi:AAA family ATPase [Nocardia fusca]|uniref:AAA family ATPase n=1 Tax=Nocardia fusca TaxID=941183 RepID=UPI00379E2912